MNTYKDYCGLRIYADGLIYKNTHKGYVVLSKPEKFVATLVLEAWKGKPKRAKHRNLWFLDQDPTNLRLDNLRWGEISQELHPLFIEEVRKVGLATAVNKYKVSPEFGAFMVEMARV